jgi:hypothetical protein
MLLAKLENEITPNSHGEGGSSVASVLTIDVAIDIKDTSEALVTSKTKSKEIIV